MKGKGEGWVLLPLTIASFAGGPRLNSTPDMRYHSPFVLTSTLHGASEGLPHLLDFKTKSHIYHQLTESQKYIALAGIPFPSMITICITES